MRHTIFIILFLFNTIFETHAYDYIIDPGPKYPPTKGEVWPIPRWRNYSDHQMIIDPQKFDIQSINVQCDDIDSAINRYKNIILKPKQDKSSKYGKNKKQRKQRDIEIEMTFSSVENGSPRIFKKLIVDLKDECQTWPSIDMVESYYLIVRDNGEALLESGTIWGIYRGLETFSQLVIYEHNTLKINATEIEDEPRFKHRGLLLDTSRHFISMKNIFTILDGMTYNKLNVFHWHIVDDQSFPYKGDVFPSLAEKGKYHSSMVYDIADVRSVVNYARKRGIRVIAEFDTPGHTRSWGEAYPWLLTKCYKNGKPTGKLGPIDPTNDQVYSFINELFKEVVKVFPDQYLHLGGDEVGFKCWESNPDIMDFMSIKNITSKQLEEIYIQKIVDLVDDLHVKPIVYQEVYENGVRLPKNTIIQVWTNDQRTLLNNITKAGLPVLLSTCWYLDHLKTGGDWGDFYDCEPHDFDGTDAQKQLIFGGEACMWSEVVDDANVVSRIFPRVSATAEKLWSDEYASTYEKALYRMEEHYCRMKRRGVAAQPPTGPGFCVL